MIGGDEEQGGDVGKEGIGIGGALPVVEEDATTTTTAATTQNIEVDVTAGVIGPGGSGASDSVAAPAASADVIKSVTPKTAGESSDDDSYVPGDDGDGDDPDPGHDEHSLPTVEELYVDHAQSMYDARSRSHARQILALADNVTSGAASKAGTGNGPGAGSSTGPAGIGIGTLGDATKRVRRSLHRSGSTTNKDTVVVVEADGSLTQHQPPQSPAKKFCNPVVICVQVVFVLVLAVSLSLGLALRDRRQGYDGSSNNTGFNDDPSDPRYPVVEGDGSGGGSSGSGGGSSSSGGHHTSGGGGGGGISAGQLSESERLERLQSYLITRGVSGHNDFDSSSTVTVEDYTPQQRALDFLVYDDVLSKSWVIPTDGGSDNGNNDGDGYRFVTRYALAVLYYATSGETTWINQFNFLQPNEDVCIWNYLSPTRNAGMEGVICDDDQVITGIWFANNGLKGTIPKEIGSLSTLETIGIIGNPQLTGSIPETFEGSLTSLREFIVRDNMVTGQIPAYMIRGYHSNHIQALDVSNNQLTGVLPLNITSQNANLRLLNIANNNFEGTIDGIYASFPNIEFMHMEKNLFSGPLYPPGTGLNSGELSEELRSITTTNPWLIEFDLSSNQLTGTIPRDWYQLTDLEVWDIHDNSIVGTIPSSGSDAPLQNAPNLWYINMNQNYITGSIPTSLGYDIPSLKHFDVSYNELTGPATLIPQELLGTNVKNTLRNLFLGHNPFEAGPIPTFIYTLSNLRELSIHATNRGKSIGNAAAGNGTSTSATLSPLIKALQELVLIDVHDNAITGTIPKEIADIPTLRYLLLQRNYLSGTVPPEIGTQLEDLRFLLVDRNDLTGTMYPICSEIDLNSTEFALTTAVVAADCKTEVECPCCDPCCEDMDAESCHDHSLLDTIDYDTNYQRTNFQFYGVPNNRFGDLINP